MGFHLEEKKEKSFLVIFMFVKKTVIWISLAFLDDLGKQGREQSGPPFCAGSEPEAMCIPAGYEGILSSLSSEQGFFFLFSLGLKSISCSRR